jgi:hypothetical protein
MAEIDQHPSVPSAPAARPRRANTILGRLAQDIREQNWFAVGLELVIVIAGVVIGFQVTAWGQAHANQEKEQVYLRQLSLDLAETERRADSIGLIMAPLTHAPRRLAQAHFLPEPPPRDSVITWASLAPVYYEVSPVLGTAEALVATGDIGIIRDDSLRTAITAYLEVSRENIRGAAGFVDLLVQTNSDLFRSAPMATILAESVGPVALDSLDREDDWRALAPPGVPLPALDTDALVLDPQIHGLMMVIAAVKGTGGMAWHRGEIRRNAAALRERVDARIER